MRLCQTVQIAQLLFQTKLSSFVLILVIVLEHDGNGFPKSLNSYLLYTLLNFIGSLFISLTLSMPTFLQNYFDTSVSCKRIKNFLLLPETDLKFKPQINDSSVPYICCDSLGAKWNDDKDTLTLSNINLNLHGPQLVALVGPVGCGKSSLLQIILNELPSSSGLNKRSSSINYLSQPVWIIPGTIRDNVVGGLLFDIERYQTVLKVTNLDIDLNYLPLGDETEVGERGIILSGGQKSRVALARLAYSTKKCVLLDDPLAAVDVHVANHIFHQCIKEFMADRLIILTTHQIHLLPEMDKIIVIKEGKIEHIGNYEELESKKCLDFGEDLLEESVDDVIDDICNENNYSDINDDEIVDKHDSEIQEEILNMSHVSSILLNTKQSKDKLLVKFDPSSICLRSRQSSCTTSTFNSIDEKSPYSLCRIKVNGEMETIPKRGSINWRNYFTLCQIGAGYFGLFFIPFLFLLAAANYLFCDIWIAKWSTLVDSFALSNKSEENSTFKQFHGSINDINYYYLNVSIALTFSLVMLSLLRTLSYFVVFINAGKQIHNQMIKACLGTRLQFFETKTSGEILNRFSKDMGIVDDALPVMIHEFMQCFFMVVANIALSLFSSYWTVLPLVPFIVLFCLIRSHYLHTARNLKRMASALQSPVFTQITVTLQGLPCIRAGQMELEYIEHFDNALDNYTKACFVSVAATRWFVIRLEFICILFVTSALGICISLGFFSIISAANIGLLLTYYNSFVGVFQWCVNQSAEVENQMVSVERAIEYMNLDPEMDQTINRDKMEHGKWPRYGHLKFEDFGLRYNTKSAWALKHINLDFKPGLKIGIVGRTGAGKSSLISALFRLVEGERGRILIDDIDIRHLELSTLRKHISIIPQDPVMFMESVRNNLDPDNKHSDENIWHALRCVKMDKIISKLTHGLHATISEGGLNFSTGQRQLIALARSILGGNRIIVVDEATANVDLNTDGFIQQTLQKQFSQCTVLTVAHRLHTVIDNNLIVMMDKGRVVEIGEAHFLLNPKLALSDSDTFLKGGEQIPDLWMTTNDDGNKQIEYITGKGPFANLVRRNGSNQSKQLAKIARNSFFCLRSLTAATVKDNISVVSKENGD